MGYARYSHANISRTKPSPLGTCDRCGFIYNRDQLTWQFQWAGPRLQNQQILVCDLCLDTPQMQLRSIIIPPDPVPIIQPRQDPYMYMGQSSSPPGYMSGQPNVLATENDDPLTTESSIPLITEINVTPTPTSSGWSDNND